MFLKSLLAESVYLMSEQSTSRNTWGGRQVLESREFYDNKTCWAEQKRCERTLKKRPGTQEQHCSTSSRSCTCKPSLLLRLKHWRVSFHPHTKNWRITFADQINIFFLAEKCVSARLALSFLIKESAVPFLVTHSVCRATSLNTFSPDLDLV